MAPTLCACDVVGVIGDATDWDVDIVDVEMGRDEISGDIWLGHRVKVLLFSLAWVSSACSFMYTLLCQ